MFMAGTSQCWVLGVSVSNLSRNNFSEDIEMFLEDGDPVSRTQDDLK
jgi:hypothetical protein